jgi:Flp pilus assembly protein TadB
MYNTTGHIPRISCLLSRRNRAFGRNVHKATHGAVALERRLIMAKRRRRRKSQDDPIRDFQEWQNHQYDPGYIFKLTQLRLFSGGNRHIARYLLIFLGMFSLVILVLPMLSSAGETQLVLLIGGIVLITVVLVISLRRGRRSERRN